MRGSNDTEMLAEVARRRYRDNSSQIANCKLQIAKVNTTPETRNPKPETRQAELPDLVLVDGGIAQLNAVGAVLKELKVKIPLASIAKKFEEVFREENGKARKIYDLSLTSPALHLLQSVRDEAHRFAIRYHKILRGREISRSVLDSIKGIGEKRKKALLGRFGSVDKIREASVRELKKIGIPVKIAEQILNQTSLLKDWRVYEKV